MDTRATLKDFIEYFESIPEVAWQLAGPLQLLGDTERATPPMVTRFKLVLQDNGTTAQQLQLLWEHATHKRAEVLLYLHSLVAPVVREQQIDLIRRWLEQRAEQLVLLAG